MSGSSKKQTFLHGAALLAIATALVKIIGALYKLPLTTVIGDQGFGYFSTAYEIYSVLLLISNAGLPIAMSRMISQASSLGNYNQVRRIFKISRAVFFGLGILSTLLMTLFCRQLAAFQKQPDAWMAILCLGPSAVLMAGMSVYRGYFQGQGDMRPTSVSQVLEAIFKLVVGLGAAIVVKRQTGSVAAAAAGAIAGVTFSCLVSMLFMQRKFAPAFRELPKSEDVPESGKKITKSLLAIAVPITIGAAGLQLLTVLETNIYMGRLLIANGLSQNDADTVKGIYNFAQTLFNMPCAFIVPITTSVLPAVTSFLTLKDEKGVRSTEESGARITGLISLPCAVGFLLLGAPIMGLLRGYEGQTLELAGKLLAILGVCVFPYAVIQYVNALLQSHGHAHVPVINMLAIGVVRLAVVYLLVSNKQIGILGAPIGAALGYIATAVLNLICARKLIAQKPAILKNLLRSFLPAAVMGVVVWLSSWGLEKLLGADASRIILGGVPIAVGAVVYLVGVVVFKAITKEDCQLLPKGEKIAKLLHL